MLKASKPRELVKAASSLAKFAPPALRGDRISDAGRERAVERLNDALVEGRVTVPEFEERFDAVHAAVYQADLRVPLTGLPADEISSLTAGGGRSDADVLVLRAGAGGLKRAGAWVVPARMQVKSGMGSVELDFSETKIQHRVVQIELKLGTGSAKLLLPDDATANLDALVATTGSIKSNVASQPSARAPHFVVLGRTRLGSVTVRPRRSFAGLRF
ncbi:MAG: DUF1707 domain-containing protein [Solirubrobacteraceae bacterium]